MNYYGPYRRLLGNSTSATVAAMEIYKQPRFEYRDEVFVPVVLLPGISQQLYMFSQVSKRRRLERSVAFGDWRGDLLEHTVLMKRLDLDNQQVLYAKALELRDAVSAWLEFIPNTFPHYTRHTASHSEEIIQQIGKLLFVDDDIAKPTLQLSPLEIYILIVSAYLHDAGMVTPDSEKAEILTSAAWKEWTSGDGGGARRWKEIHLLREGETPSDEPTRHFLADLETRFLIAEYVRRSHHSRAKRVVSQHEPLLARFAFGDPALKRTIADICVAHGLAHYELDDVERYPDRRDLRGHQVNVRLMALLLRLGDLLDMSYDRACPLLLNATCPLPADSLAHWTQYSRIVHRLTAPDKLEITAECNTQEEHRILQDWCQWIVDEVEHAASLMAHARRHAQWIAPHATLEGSGATIQIRPSESASYIPSRWTFELDPDQVFQRLIEDVYESPSMFIRELIQNACDASRCQLYSDIIAMGEAPPEYPNEADESLRRQFPITVKLETIDVTNELSGEQEERQIVTVEDLGIGMDRDIIERYFLQVGRSFYTTREFQRSYRFVPTSRFGIGFLSVFATSNHVEVETFKPSAGSSSLPIKLTLTGPRNYLLSERGMRRHAGTRIAVVLRERMEQGKLTELIVQWCRRVEFPIHIDDLGVKRRVEGESEATFAAERPHVRDPEVSFVVKAFPIAKGGIFGELYVCAKCDSRGEDWADWSWDRYSYTTQHPFARTLSAPASLVCTYGISLGTDRTDNNSHLRSFRLDLRSSREELELALSRTHIRRGPSSSAHWTVRNMPEVREKWEEIVAQHIENSGYAVGPDAWRYKQKLSSIYSFLGIEFWSSVPETVRVYKESRLALHSLRDLNVMESFAVVNRSSQNRAALTEETLRALGLEDGWVLDAWDLFAAPSLFSNSIFSDFEVEGVELVDGEWVVTKWYRSSDKRHMPKIPGLERWRLSHLSLFPMEPPYSNSMIVSAFGSGLSLSSRFVINSNNPLVQWLINIGGRLGEVGVDESRFGIFTQLFEVAELDDEDDVEYVFEDVEEFLAGWRSSPELSDSRPPDCPIKRTYYGFSAG